MGSCVDGRVRLGMLLWVGREGSPVLNVVEVFGTNLTANVESIGPTRKGRYFGNAFLKAHRQISKKRCFEMYCYVIKHAIFQLYRVHTDEVI